MMDLQDRYLSQMIFIIATEGAGFIAERYYEVLQTVLE